MSTMMMVKRSNYHDDDDDGSRGMIVHSENSSDLPKQNRSL